MTVDLEGRRLAATWNCIVLTLALATPAMAEEGIVGSYRGNFTNVGTLGRVPIGIDLVIEQSENGVVRATMVRYTSRPEAGAACNGRYVMNGTYDGKTLTLRAKNGGDSGDCRFGFTAVLVGNRLVGTYGRNQQPIELVKREP